jgi:Flp pilus assembly protein TadB
MKRRLALRDRMAWIIAALAVAIVAYLFLPKWVLVAGVVLLIGVPALARQRRRQRARH